MSAPQLRQPGLLVFSAGVATSALVLWVIHTFHLGIMGWYANMIFPVGAIAVGIASGLGYALGSYFLDVKLSKAFVLGMITTGLFDYAAAQYLSYQRLLELHGGTAEQYSFFAYFRDLCEQMTFSHNGGAPGSPLGAWGYLFKTLEVAGFSLGTMIPSAVLFAMPYCRRCQHYLKKERVGYAASSSTRKQVFDLPRKERAAALQQAVEQAAGHGQAVMTRLQNASLLDSRTALGELAQRQDRDAAAVMEVVLRKCPRCDAHEVALTLVHRTLDKKQARKLYAKVDRTELSPA